MSNMKDNSLISDLEKILPRLEVMLENYSLLGRKQVVTIGDYTIRCAHGLCANAFDYYINSSETELYIKALKNLYIKEFPYDGDDLNDLQTETYFIGGFSEFTFTKNLYKTDLRRNALTWFIKKIKEGIEDFSNDQ